MLEEKQKKLDRLLSLLDPDNALSRKDFEESFKQVLELVMKLIQKHEQAIQQLLEDNNHRTEGFKQDYTSNLSELRKQVNQLFVEERLKQMDTEQKASIDRFQKMVNEAVENKLQEADERVSQLKPIKGDKGDRGDMGPMPTEHLELMKQMMAEMKKVQDILSNIPRGRAMGRAKVPMPRTIDLTSDQNGAARVFNIPPDTVRIFGGISSQFPFAIASSDISRSGNQITLNDTIAPRATGQTLLIFTDALFYP